MNKMNGDGCDFYAQSIYSVNKLSHNATGRFASRIIAEISILFNIAREIHCYKISQCTGNQYATAIIGNVELNFSLGFPLCEISTIKTNFAPQSIKYMRTNDR